MRSEKITLIIFTCEGREHLLCNTYTSFKSNCDYPFAKTVLAIDGKISPEVMDYIQPDVVVQSPSRKGYVSSIMRALPVIDTAYFFWLEDDFIFNQKVPVDYMFEVLSDNTWASLFLSRTAPLKEAEKSKHYFNDLYVPDFGLSVSPSLCNTGYFRDALKKLIEVPKDNTTRLAGFEPFLDNYFTGNNLKYAVVDPGDIAHVDHIGQLESTAREYHMINSLDSRYSSINREYISGFGFDRKITFKNKLLMMFKLWAGTFSLTFRLWFFRNAYDFAFRVYLGYQKKFKN